MVYDGMSVGMGSNFGAGASNVSQAVSGGMSAQPIPRFQQDLTGHNQGQYNHSTHKVKRQWKKIQRFLRLTTHQAH